MATLKTIQAKEWGLTILRVVVGYAFARHGGHKLFTQGFHAVAGFMASLGLPFPMACSVIVTLLEFLGGLALILGLLTRWVTLLISIEMLVAIFVVHLKGGFFAPKGIELPLLMLAANISLWLTGPGAAAMDSSLSRKSK